MEERCAYCYVSSETLLRCGQCHKRKYCGRECQVLDWKQGHHRHFCKVGVGEFGVDWEVKESPETGGLGVFALRPIQKDENIMVERPIVTLKLPTSRLLTRPLLLTETDIPKTARPAFKSLHPPNGGLADKFRLNSMSLTDDGDDDDEGHLSAVFIRMSRVNHRCLGNSDHRYLENRKLKILVANRAIDEGEEITFSYRTSTPDAMTRRAELLSFYGFRCFCKVCRNPDLAAELERMKDLDNTILSLGSLGRVEHAMQKGKALIKLYDKHGMSSWLYHRTYYDLYQVAITKRKTYNQGVKFIKKSYEAALAFTSDPQYESVRKMKAFVDAPSTHRNYMLLN